MSSGEMTAQHAEDGASARWRFPNRATAPGSSAYYCVRLADAAKRDSLAALLGWHGEVRAVLEQVSDLGVARVKLDWWRQEIVRTLANEPRHPLSRLLAESAADGQLPEQPFMEIIDTADAALQGQPHADRNAQRESDRHDLGALFELMARSEGSDEPRSLENARRAGVWCAQVRRVRDAGWLLRRGREVITADRLQSAGIGHAEIETGLGRSRLAELLRPLAAELKTERIEAADQHRLTPSLRVQLRIHQDLLGVLERSGFDVGDQRIALTPLRKLWLAWRASR